MEDIQEKLNNFKEIVKENSKNENFEFREWFVDDHLKIVERIAMEICDIHKEADRDIVTALVWFHDFGKPIDIQNERQLTKEKGIEAMKNIGFPKDFIDKVFKYWERMEMKNEIDLSQEVIEVQIISTADGASHFVGQFYPSYFGDIPKKSLKETREELKKKIKVDWERKIVIPEVKEAFKDRYLKALELLGEYPEKFL